jgi:low temperature requirement protein LtrA
MLFVAVGWGGLFLLLNSTEPTLWPRWLFFFLIVVAFTGTALPVASFFNHRFPGEPPATVRVILRQALWVGVFAGTLAWLRIGGILNAALAIMLAAAFIAIEWFVRLRERAHWNPND